jgi:hypothetical protein
MHDLDALLGGMTMKEYVHFTQEAIFELRNYLAICVGYGEMAREEVQPSHAGFVSLTKVLSAADGARAVVRRFDDRFRRHAESKEDSP